MLTTSKKRWWLLAMLAVLAPVLWLEPAAAAAPGWSELWGADGGIWDPAGRLPDFSFAGYKQGNEPIPSPRATKSVLDFNAKHRTQSQMLKSAVKWANAQPSSKGWVVLTIPAGEFTLDERLELKRSKLVLRGAGSGSGGTTLYIPKSLTDLYGPNPEVDTGGYVWSGAFVTVRGLVEVGDPLAKVTKEAKKGATTVVVDNPGKLVVGQYYDMWWTDIGGKFNNLMFDNKWSAPAGYRGQRRAKMMVKVIGKSDKTITLERHLPYDIKAGVSTVYFHDPPPTVTDVGVEGIRFKFKHELYRGHHYERGWSAVELLQVRDCWVRNVATINADNGITVDRSQSITITGVEISVSKTRANSKYPSADQDGHWGIQHGRTFDLLASGFVTRCKMHHDLGTDSASKWGVYMSGKLSGRGGGNTDFHRALAGPALYTDIDVGGSVQALSSGGPKSSGPHTVAGSTWWGIKSSRALDIPRDAVSTARSQACAFGPVINLVDVWLNSGQVKSQMCPTWWYEPSIRGPHNLYKSQLVRRLGRERAAEILAPLVMKGPWAN